MNILELDSFNLADTVKFHDRLNPRLWNRDEHLLPDVHAKLLEIAKDFQEFLGVPDLDVKDITISGSNAAFNYTNSSDIDLHLVIDVPDVEHDEVYRELFNAKKYQYNDEHDIRIHGADVELYAQDSKQEHHSQGIYSLLRNTWVSVPKRKKAQIDDTSVRSKYQDLAARIEETIKTQNYHRMADLMKKIKTMRQTGLEQNGEFGSDNIAFKLLRNNGYIKKLADARQAARDAELSLAESKRVKKPFIYGYVSESPDGVNPSTKMFLEVDTDPQDHTNTVNEFIEYVIDRLGIDNPPAIELHTDPTWSEEQRSFGRYIPEAHTLEVNLANRHIMDILRTTAHELVHCKQNELQALPDHAGETGSEWENRANAIAGVIMRDYADSHPEKFADHSIAESASGYIPKNKKEARDPRYAMALTQDIKPGQVGKEANKLALDTDSQGKPALLMKSFNLRESLEAEFAMFESQDLFEINMGSKNLRKEAAATGALAGMEFEMIVPNVQDPDNDGDMEPDYEADERVRDIDDCVNFFDDGDYNSNRELRSLRENMQEDYHNWVYEQTSDEWDNNGFEFFKEYLDREEPFDEEEYLERARDMVAERHPEITAGTDEYDDAIREALNEINAEYYTETWEAQGRSYDNAREEFEEEQRDNFSEQDWLENEGIRYATDVSNKYDITWPYYTSSNNGEGDIDQVADEFSRMIGKPVNASSNYHGARREPGHYVVEPDGSLEADSDDDTGLEFVSPPMPIDEMISDLNKVKRWAGTYGCYTNDSTGLHINISVPDYSLEKLDFVKLALLLGDEYVLKNFGRSGNTYAKSAMKLVKEKVRSNPEVAKQLLDKMKSNLDGLATKAIHSGTTSKYTSINTKDGYIEFRSPGGDWLDENFDKIENTLMRFTVAMSAAINPNAYRQEYQKKLYKLLTADNKDNDTIKYFAQYAAGELPKAALRSFVKQAQLERKIARDPNKGQDKWWWNVKLDGQRIEVVALDNIGAWQAAIKEYPEWARRNQGEADISPIRPYSDSEKPKQPTGPTLNGRPSNPDGNYVIVDGANEQTPVYRYMAADGNDALLVLRQWIAANPGQQWNFKFDPTQLMGQPGEQQSTANHNWCIRRRDSQEIVKTFQADDYRQAFEVLQRYKEEHGMGPANNSLTYGPYNPAEEQPTQQQDNWGIWINTNERFANQPGTYARGETPPLYRFPSREAAEQWIEQQRAERPNMRTDIEVREIEPAAAIPGSTLDLQRQRAAAARDTSQFGAATGAPNWEIERDRDHEVVHRFYADNQNDAIIQATDFMNMQGWSNDDYTIQTAFAGTDGNSLRPTGPGPWEVASRSNNQVYFNPPSTYRRNAESEARTWLAQNGHNEADFEVRTREGVSNTDAAQGGTVDVAGEQPAQAPRTLTTPGQGQQVFTGEWKVLLPDGREVYRFSGVGNSQSDANRVAAVWLRNNGMGVSGEGFEVLPVMG